MDMEKRGVYYRHKTIDRNIELDYIDSTISTMKLRTVATYRITSATVNRPDLISIKFLGSYNYGWLLSRHNQILDPFNDYYLGRVINIPAIDDLYRFYNRNSVEIIDG